MNLARILILLVLVIVGCGLSGLLLLDHYGESGQAAALADRLCGEGVDNGCEEVAASPYSRVQGVPLAAAGLFCYLSLGLLFTLMALSGAQTRAAGAALALAVVAVSLAIDLMLLGVQAFAIGRYCTTCILTYVVNAGMLALLLPARRGAAAMVRVLGQAESRLAFAGWAAGSLAALAAVGAANLLLVHRAEGRQAGLLGMSPVAAAPASVAPPTTLAPEAGLSPAEPPESAPPTTAAGASDPNRELRDARAEVQRLQGILDDPQKLQAYLDIKATRAFEAEKAVALDLTQIPFNGPADAPIRVVAYSDFLCPFCRSIAGAFANFLPHSANRVAIYFKHYPLDRHCNTTLKADVHIGACQLALGAVCAHQQGRFWQFHDKAFAAQLKEPKLEDVLRVAAEAGLDYTALETCMASTTAKQALEAQILEARRLGVTATPTVFVNGKRLGHLNDFLLAVNSEAQRLKLPPTAPPARQ